MPYNSDKDLRLKLPDNHDLKIWRYMDLAKFIDLIEKKSLYFSTLNELKDFFEGKYPSSIWNLRSEKEFKIKLEEIERKTKTMMTVNCWNLSEDESLGLWSVYVNGRGIAVESTIGNLINSLHDTSEDIEMGLVRYIDYKIDMIDKKNIYDLVSYKRRLFEFEHEIRLFFQKEKINKNQIKKKGTYIRVDLKKLITRIILSPSSQAWYKEVIEDILREHRLTKLIKNVNFSELDEKREIF